MIQGFSPCAVSRFFLYVKAKTTVHEAKKYNRSVHAFTAAASSVSLARSGKSN